MAQAQETPGKPIDILEKSEGCEILTEIARNPKAKITDRIKAVQALREMLGWKNARPRGRGEEDQNNKALLEHLENKEL
jgi:hypothetical protein